MKNDFAVFPKRTALRVPTFDEITGDFWAAFAAMLVALPASIAFGVAIYGVLGPRFLAEGALAGIIGAVILGLVAPLLGGASRLVSAPSAPAAAVMTSFAAELYLGRNGIPGLPAPHVLLLLMIATLLAGAMQIAYGIIGGGRLIKYIPYPVISGFITGVGVLILITQTPNLFGFSADIGIWTGLSSPSAWQWSSVIIAGLTIGGIVIAPRLTSSVPPMIVGLFAGMIAYLGVREFGLPYFRIENTAFVAGPITGGLGSIVSMVSERWKALAELKLAELALVVGPAITLSILLSVDTLKTCVIVDVLTRTRHNSDHELFGQGVANVASALAGGLPGSGTSGPTLVNVHSGAKTRLSGVLEGALVLVVFLLLGKMISGVPVAALAGILTIVAVRMIDRSSLYLLKKKSTVLDFFIILAVTIVAVRFNLIIAAGVGLGLSILLFMREQIRGSVVRRKLYGHQISSKQQRLPAEKEILQKKGSLITVCQLQSSLFFGTTDQLFEELEMDLKRCRFLILEMGRVQSVDFTAVHMLDQIRAILEDRDGHLLFAHVPVLPTGQDLASYFNQLELVAPTRSAVVFDTLDEALEWAEDKILAEARTAFSKDETALALNEIELLRGIDRDALELLQECVEARTCEAGEVVFRGGDIGDELFLIRSGVVRIVLQLDGDRRYNLTAFGRGDFFGDMAFLDNDVRSADAIAVVRTELFSISRARFDGIVERHPYVGTRVFALLSKALAIRLRYANNELRAAHDA